MAETEISAFIKSIPLPSLRPPTAAQGTINQQTGEVALDFDCEFFFTLGPLYSAPPLVIHTLLTSESTRGRFKEGQGSRLSGQSVK